MNIINNDLFLILTYYYYPNDYIFLNLDNVSINNSNNDGNNLVVFIRLLANYESLLIASTMNSSNELIHIYIKSELSYSIFYVFII
jgi:hypothetical protein